MAIELELDSSLQFDGMIYEEGTLAKKLTKAAREAAKAANGGRGIFRVQRAEEEDISAALAEMDNEEEESEEEED